jgi:hypothetical protein
MVSAITITIGSTAGAVYIRVKKVEGLPYPNTVSGGRSLHGGSGPQQAALSCRLLLPRRLVAASLGWAGALYGDILLLGRNINNGCGHYHTPQTAGQWALTPAVMPVSGPSLGPAGLQGAGRLLPLCAPPPTEAH